MPLLSFTDAGIFCEIGNFYIDPWKKVECAIITHAHSDHSRWGNAHYIAHNLSIPIMKLRLGADISVSGRNYGEAFYINGVKISLHPAGHILGSSQIRVEHKGEIWVASGDYKTTYDGVCEAFEPVKCHSFITESTFGLPIFNWKSQNQVFNDINKWWLNNSENDVCTVLAGYSLGKAQRILQNLDTSIGKIYVHGAIANIQEAYHNIGVDFNETLVVNAAVPKENYRKAMILMPPSAMDSPWMKKFEPYSLGIASGWMTMRGARRRRNADQGFVLSDHADWHELNEAIAATEAERIFVTHGYTDAYVKFLKEQGLDAYVAKTDYSGELLDSQDEN